MAKFTVLVTHEDIPKQAIDLLRTKCDVILMKRGSTQADLIHYAGYVDAVLLFGTWRMGKDFVDRSRGKLKVVGNMGVGVDHIDVPYLKSHNVKISNTPGTLENSVAEVAIGLALSVGHRMKEGCEKIKEGVWERAEPQWLLGQEITGSTVGILGLGNVGKAIAKRLRVFEPGRIIYTGRSRKFDDAQSGAEFVPFEEFVRESDFLFICCPSTPETRFIINKTAMDMMKMNAIIINVARGDIIDQVDLYSALQNNHIMGAGLDVMTPEPIDKDHPLLSLKNCILTPHIGSATLRARSSMALLAARNILAALYDEKMPSPL